MFRLVFRGVNGDLWVEHLLTSLPGGQLGFLIVVNIMIFVLAFFLDFFELAFIIIPLLAPVADKLGIDLIWFGVLLGVNMQTSFMHPPFGFALFYLRSVAPSRETIDRVTGRLIAPVTTAQIYWGAIPFVIIQLVMVAVLIGFPDLCCPRSTAAPRSIRARYGSRRRRTFRPNCRSFSQISSIQMTPETMPIGPAIVVHSLAHAVAALQAAAETGRPVLLLSAVDAGLSAGAGWWREAITAARSSVPTARAAALLDCGDDAGAAQNALRVGVEAIVFTGSAGSCRAPRRHRPPTREPGASRASGSGARPRRRFFAPPETLRRRVLAILAGGSAEIDVSPTSAK